MQNSVNVYNRQGIERSKNLSYGIHNEREINFPRNSQDLEIIDKFQRYAGRRVQRLPPFSPNETSFAPYRSFNMITSEYVSTMYRTIVRNRQGIG